MLETQSRSGLDVVDHKEGLKGPFSDRLCLRLRLIPLMFPTVHSIVNSTIAMHSIHLVTDVNTESIANADTQCDWAPRTHSQRATVFTFAIFPLMFGVTVNYYIEINGTCLLTMVQSLTQTLTVSRPKATFWVGPSF